MRKKKLLALAIAGAMITQNSIGIMADTGITENVNTVVMEVLQEETVNEKVVEKSYETDTATEDPTTPNTTADGYVYSLSGTTATITGYTGEEEELYLPAEIEGCAVVAIGENAFNSNGMISYVDIPEGVTSIGAGVFAGCTALISVNIPEGLTSIGAGAFADCKVLEYMYIPSTITALGGKNDTKGVFEGCIELDEINIEKGNNNAVIGNKAFYNTGLVEIEIPGNYKQICSETFANCARLSKVIYQPSGSAASDQSIGARAFADCDALNYVNLPTNVGNIDNTAFEGSENVVVYGVKGSYAESFAKSNGVNYGVYLEATASNGYSYKVEGDVVTLTDYSGSDVNITVPTTIDGYTVSAIGRETYAYNDAVETVIISEGISEIGMYAFSSCPNLNSVIIPSTMVYIGEGAFENCIMLENAMLVEGKKDATIGSFAFYNCVNIETINIPKNYMLIKDHAFNLCTGLLSADWQVADNGREQVFEDYAFTYCDKLVSISLPNTITKIPTSAFEMCTLLEEITIPEGVITIGEGAFYACSSLSSIIIPSTVIELGIENEMYGPFENCTNLTNITILEGKNDAIIGDYAFDDAAMSYIEIPGNYKLIGYDAFSSCDELTLVDYRGSGAKDQVIGTFAFEYCYALTGVNLTDSVIEIANDAFYLCESVNIYGPKGCYAETYARENNIPFKVYNGELKVAVSSNSLANTLNITTNVTSGIAPFTYSYIVHNKTTNQWARLADNSILNTYSWAASSVGERVFYVDVMDATGKVVRSSGITHTTTAEDLKLKGTAKADKTLTQIGDEITFSATATGGTGPFFYSYIVYNKSTGSWYRLVDNSIHSSYTWTAGSVGDRVFYVDVKDSTGKVVRCNALNVNTVEKLELKASATATNQTPAIGQSVTFKATATGGTGPYTYSYIVHNETTNEWYRLVDNSTSDTFTWTATSAGVRTFYVDVKDATGKVVRCNPLKVSTPSPELKATAKASTAAATVGTKITFSVTATGGTAPYTYSYIVYNKTTNQWARLVDNSSVNTFTWTAGSVGDRVFYIDVKDATGKVVRAEGVSVNVK